MKYIRKKLSVSFLRFFPFFENIIREMKISFFFSIPNTGIRCKLGSTCSGQQMVGAVVEFFPLASGQEFRVFYNKKDHSQY